jgi:hypothetical protein
MPTFITPDRPIRTLEDLPQSGLVLWSDFLSRDGDRRLLHMGQSTYRRMALNGEAPPKIKLAGRLASHAEHVRAIATGQDWRSVKLHSQTAAA